MTREHGWTQLHIDALLVDQAVWHQGVGTALLTAAEAWGRDHDAQVVRLAPLSGGVALPAYRSGVLSKSRTVSGVAANRLDAPSIRPEPVRCSIEPVTEGLHRVGRHRK
jgi:GNAT superfamily N-acetyltransferase